MVNFLLLGRNVTCTALVNWFDAATNNYSIELNLTDAIEEWVTRVDRKSNDVSAPQVDHSAYCSTSLTRTLTFFSSLQTHWGWLGQSKTRWKKHAPSGESWIKFRKAQGRIRHHIIPRKCNLECNHKARLLLSIIQSCAWLLYLLRRKVACVLTLTWNVDVHPDGSTTNVGHRFVSDKVAIHRVWQDENKIKLRKIGETNTEIGMEI